jgi:hypothetical protein
MKLIPRFHRHVSAWLCLAAMLFAQAAYAAQACIAVAPPADELPCHQQEPAGKNLCQNHCLAEQQTLDTGKLPVVYFMDEVVLVLPAITSLSTPGSHRLIPRAIARGGAPPLSILHCCFRI